MHVPHAQKPVLCAVCKKLSGRNRGRRGEERIPVYAAGKPRSALCGSPSAAGAARYDIRTARYDCSGFSKGPSAAAGFARVGVRPSRSVVSAPEPSLPASAASGAGPHSETAGSGSLFHAKTDGTFACAADFSDFLLHFGKRCAIIQSSELVIDKTHGKSRLPHGMAHRESSRMRTGPLDGDSPSLLSGAGEQTVVRDGAGTVTVREKCLLFAEKRVVPRRLYASS